MKKFTFKKSLLIMALAILPMTFFGQEEQLPSSYWTIGIEGGATQLFGDNQPFKMDQTSFDAGLFLGYTFNNAAYLYGNAGYVKLKGIYENVFKNEADVIDANLNIGYDILQLFKFNPNRVLGIVPHIGLGIAMHKSMCTYDKSGKVVKTGYPDVNKGKGINGRRLAYEIPFGVNFMFNITKKFNVNLDVVSTMTDTDWLDARASGKYDKDWYGTVNLGLAYKFGHKSPKPCPVCPDLNATLDCESCAEDIKQAVKEAVDEAMKNNPCQQEAIYGDEEEADNTESSGVAPFKEIDLDLGFKVGQSKVENTIANRNQIQEVRDEINNGQQISSIKVDGYASPEGNDKQNEKLSEDRANAAVNYIKDNLGRQVKNVDIETEGHGSDWDGFFKALEESNISDKAQIKNSIQNAEDPTAKLNELKAQYPALEDILKSLRRAKVSFFN